jgi:hypothetical protein
MYYRIQKFSFHELNKPLITKCVESNYPLKLSQTSKQLHILYEINPLLHIITFVMGQTQLNLTKLNYMVMSNVRACSIIKKIHKKTT